MCQRGPRAAILSKAKGFSAARPSVGTSAWVEWRQAIKEFSLVMRCYRAHKKEDPLQAGWTQRNSPRTRKDNVKWRNEKSKAQKEYSRGKNKDPGRSVGSVIPKATERRWISERHGRSGPGQWSELTCSPRKVTADVQEVKLRRSWKAGH